MANEATRNVNFKLRVEGDQSVGRTFNELERRIAELQQQMNLRLTLANDIRRRGDSSGGSSPYAGGNGSTSQQVLNQREQAERTSSRRIADIRRASDERMRIEAEASAKLVEKANRESLDQQIKDLRKSEADRQKILQQTQREREKQLRAETKSDADYWKDFSRFGQRTKKEREAREQLEQRESQRRTAEQTRENDVWRLAGFGPGGGTIPHGTSAWSTPRGSGLEDLADYGRASRQQRQRQDREAEMAVARQREAYARLRETVSGTAHAVTQLGEAAAMIGLVGERDIGRLADSFIRIRATVEGIRGLVGTVQQIGALRGNLAAAGGRGALGRAMLGLGPVAAGAGGTAEAGAGAGAIGAAGGVSAGAVALPAALLAALAAGGLHLATGGRSTRQFGRALGEGSISLAQMGYRARLMGHTAFMDESERNEFQAQQLERFRQGKPEQNFGMSAGEKSLAYNLISAPAYWATRGIYAGWQKLTGGDKAAEVERDTQRLSRLKAYEKEQRDRQIAKEHHLLPQQIRQTEINRERFEQEAAVQRELQGIKLQYSPEQNAELDRLKRSRSRLGERMTAAQRAYSTEMNPVEAARRERELHYLGIREQERGGQIEVEMGRRQREVGIRLQRNELATRRAGIAGQRSELEEQLKNTNESNVGDRLELEQHLAALKREEQQITREDAKLAQESYKGQIGDATKLLQLAQQRWQVTQQTLRQATEQKQSVEERLGRMNPMEFAALVRAKQRADKGEQLTLPELQLLERGGMGEQGAASKGYRSRLPQMATTPEQKQFLANLEENKRLAEATHEADEAEANLASRTQNVEGLRGAGGGNVTVGGGFNVTVDIRPDMAIAEQLSQDVGDQLQEFYGKVMVDVMEEIKKVSNDQAQSIEMSNMQRRPPVGSGA